MEYDLDLIVSIHVGIQRKVESIAAVEISTLKQFS